MIEAGNSQEILEVVGYPSPQMEEEVVATASVFRSWGYDVRVIATLSRASRRRLASSKVPYSELPALSATSVAARWNNLRELASQLRELRPNLIHAHGFRAGLAAVLSRRGISQPAPIVLSPHLLPHRLSGSLENMLRRRTYRWMLRRCAAVVVPTEVQRRQLRLVDAHAAATADLVPYGILRCPLDDPLDHGRRRQVLGMTPSAAIVGCVAHRLEPDALELFLDAARELSLQYPSLEFALIGPDADRARYHDLAHARGVLGATVVVDPRERFLRAISALDVLVLPQRGWPSGLLALQALSVSVGVVSLAGGEVAEILGGRPGVGIATEADAPALGRAVMEELEAAAERMPASETGVQMPGASPFLVSNEFFDLDRAWSVPGRGEPTAANDPTALDGALRDYTATQAARALATVYHRVLDQA